MPQTSAFLHPRRLCLCLLLLLSVVAAGCAPKKNTLASYTEKYRQDYEEVVVEPYTPRDDGVALTPAELKAFKSTGQLDAKLSQEDANTVELHFKYFIHEHRRTFERFLTRSARYLPHIKKVFRDRGIPEEIAYLSMVESGGNPNAISPMGAAGLWQFMPFTGRKYGLEQNSWVDQRRDPFKSTYAAADYLLKLYNDFNDWHLAVAAYNAGEGKIGRAVEGTGANGFFELCRLDGGLEEKARLRDETREYVPRLIAIAKIMRNLRTLGFEEPSPDQAYTLETISVPPGTSLSGLARKLGLTWEEFSGMNPAFRRTASPPSGTTIAYVPPEHKEEAQLWVASAEARIYADWGEYTVKRGDTLASISKRNGVSMASLRQANGFKSLPKPGSSILIPGRTAETVYAALPDKPSSATASAGTYSVQTGDTLFSLAKSWGTSVESIRQANRLGPKDNKLSLGQRLSVPGNSKSVPASVKRVADVRHDAAPPRSNYMVRPGDTIFSIARTCNISVQALCDANGFDRKNTKLKTGQSIRIPQKNERRPVADNSGKQPQATATGKDSGNQKNLAAAKDGKKDASPDNSVEKNTDSGAKPAADGKTVAVTVQPGDTLYSLSRKHGTSIAAIRQANSLDTDKLKLGQKLLMPQ